MLKSLDSSDVALRTFKVYKNWGCDETNYSSSFGLTIEDGIRDDTFFTYGDIQNEDGTYKKLVWSSIKHLYYTSGSRQEYNARRNYVDSDKLKYVSRSLDDRIRVINIPYKKIGDQIKPTSVVIIENSSSKTIVDDGNYNLYISGSSPREIIGNVFYDTGHIIISSQSYSSSLDNFDLSFQSTIKIKEYEVVCTVLEGEYNYTSNPTATMTGSGNYGFYMTPFVSSSLKPLITTIGLYNSDNELLMVGKLGRPYKREYDLDTTFVLRIDL